MRDAGIPMIRPVSGIAMGLIKDEDSPKYAVLSDILGDEDHLGDMDFKVTGTEKGNTATQMDIKCNGLSYEILEKALKQAKEGRTHILNCMLEAQPEHREDLKAHAPRMVAFDIDKEFIGAVIGPGGKIIQGIQEETGAVVTIEESDGKGHVAISSANKESIDAAVAKIKAIVAIPEEGEIYTGPIKNIQSFGAFVEFMPGKDGLLHISEIDWKRYETMEETGIKEGDVVTVKLIEIDKKTGKYRLSMKALKPKPEGYTEPEARPRREDRGERPRREERNDRPRREERPRREDRPRRDFDRPDYRGGENK
jgi:polyribonucleotide nucleotidyltransferase